MHVGKSLWLSRILNAATGSGTIATHTRTHIHTEHNWTTNPETKVHLSFHLRCGRSSEHDLPNTNKANPLFSIQFIFILRKYICVCVCSCHYGGLMSTGTIFRASSNSFCIRSVTMRYFYMQFIPLGPSAVATVAKYNTCSTFRTVRWSLTHICSSRRIFVALYGLACYTNDMAHYSMFLRIVHRMLQWKIRSRAHKATTATRETYKNTMASVSHGRASAASNVDHIRFPLHKVVHAHTISATDLTRRNISHSCVGCRINLYTMQLLSGEYCSYNLCAQLSKWPEIYWYIYGSFSYAVRILEFSKWKRRFQSLWIAKEVSITLERCQQR